MDVLALLGDLDGITSTGNVPMSTGTPLGAATM